MKLINYKIIISSDQFFEALESTTNLCFVSTVVIMHFTLLQTSKMFPCVLCFTPGPGGSRSRMPTPLSSSGWWLRFLSSGANLMYVSPPEQMNSFRSLFAHEHFLPSFFVLCIYYRISSVKSRTLWFRMRLIIWVS